MESIHIKETSITPDINFNSQTGILRVKGRSIPENPKEFYTVMLDWVAEYYKSPKEITEFWFEMEYVNSGSSRFILEILRQIKQYRDEGKETVVKWMYEEEDESIQGLGEYYRDLIQIPIELIQFI